MQSDLSILYHQSSKNHQKGHVPIDEDPARWPAEWKTVVYKAYPRLPRIALPVSTRQADLFAVITQRMSRRDFDVCTTVTLQEIACLLKYSCGTTGLMADGSRMRRAQASGGGLYPIEMYALVARPGVALAPGLYHYNVKEHALEVMWDKQFSDAERSALFVADWTKDVSVLFFMTAVFQRTRVKYGERGYRYVLIEAGHIGQNMYLVAEALGLKCCTFGGARDDEAVEKLLDIDGVNEALIYSVAVGR